MNKYLFDGLPPTVVTYIKVHLRHMYSTGLFDSQEREDLIQDLVLFYLERFYHVTDVPEGYLFISFKTKAQQIVRTRLREMQAGFFDKESLNSMSEDEGFEPASDFSLSDLEDQIAFNEVKELLTDKQKQFVDLIIQGETTRNARSKLHVTHKIMSSIEKRIKEGKRKK